MKIDIVAKCVYQTRLVASGNATRLQKLCVSSQERAIRTAVSSHRPSFFNNHSHTDLLQGVINTVDYQKKLWAGVMQRKEKLQQQYSHQLKNRLSMSFAHDRKAAKNNKETILDNRKKYEVLQVKTDKIAANKKQSESTFAQHMRDVECRSADRFRKVQENRYRLSASRSQTRSPVSQRSGQLSRHSITSSQINRNGSSYSIRNSAVRERQQFIFLEAKKELANVQMRVDLANTKRKLNLDLLKESINRKNQQVMTVHYNKAVKTEQDYQTRFGQNIQNRQRIERKFKEVNKERIADTQDIIQKHYMSFDMQRNRLLDINKKKDAANKAKENKDDFRTSLKQQIITQGRDLHHESSQERRSVHQLHMERRQKMHHLHKDILIHDILAKQQRSESVRTMRQQMIKLRQDKNKALRLLVTDISEKQRQLLQPTSIEARQAEWQQDLKKCKKVKQED